jgi:SnoaL-like domain
MTLEDHLRCERECTRLCMDFAWTVDLQKYDAFVALFAQDGVFERAGQPCVGHPAIRAFLDARPADRVTRHVCTNTRIDMTGSHAATGSCSAMMYHAPLAKDAQLPLPVFSPVIVDYADDYVLTQDGWKFKYRKTFIVFQS